MRALVPLNLHGWMAVGGQPVERLRQYLRQLSPGARALLIAELERTLLRGDEVPGGDLVLQEVRQAVRESGASAPRIGNPARLFFYRVEPFLVDDTSALKHQGRIARAALEPFQPNTVVAFSVRPWCWKVSLLKSRPNCCSTVACRS